MQEVPQNNQNKAISYPIFLYKGKAKSLTFFFVFERFPFLNGILFDVIIKGCIVQVSWVSLRIDCGYVKMISDWDREMDKDRHEWGNEPDKVQRITT